jgi:hypothetical protein
MEKYWNKDLLGAYYSYMYDRETGEKFEDADFMKNDLFWDQQLHIDRLPDTDEFNVYNPVFTSENREVSAINANYTFWRNANVVSIGSVDSVSRENIRWIPRMSNFVAKRTKLETELNLSIGQCVLFTSNDVDPNAANNSRGKIVEIIFVDGIVDCIIVAPYLSNRNLTPHPIKVSRKTRTLDYYDKNFGVLQLTRSQFPLRSADASTIHTNQGLSQTDPHIVNSQRNSNRGFGRMYVACSRATDEDLVFILFKIIRADVIACPIALAFDMFHRPNECNLSTLSEVNYTLYIYNDGNNCQILVNNNV